MVVRVRIISTAGVSSRLLLPPSCFGSRRPLPLVSRSAYERLPKLSIYHVRFDRTVSRRAQHPLDRRTAVCLVRSCTVSVAFVYRALGEGRRGVKELRKSKAELYGTNR